jgi:hypothetical protein
MSISSTDSRRRTTRKVMVSVAAFAVTLLPTACDSAYADPHAGHGSHQSAGSDSDVVPVGQTGESDDPADGEDAAGGDGENNGGDDNGGDDNGSDDNGSDDNGGDNAGGEDGDNGDGDGDNGGGLDVLGTDCSNSQLPPHDGFQLAPRCVSTSFGEVAAEDKSPSLLITESPNDVAVGQDFTLAVSTRNLVRDRFLGADAGGYYKESSFLNDEGIQRGHFHTACRMLDDLDAAPDAAPAPEFFVATQDGGGGAGADTVNVDVTGMPRAGTAQCAVWAGDGSHRLPMMQRADQTPAFDIVRIKVN